MIDSARDLLGYGIHAQDGLLGEVWDLYFDDRKWRVRYMVVETGPWFHGRKTLIAPESAGEPDPKSGTIPVELTKEKIKQAPKVDTDLPVSRQHEKDMLGHFGWTVYWHPAGAADMGGAEGLTTPAGYAPGGAGIGPQGTGGLVDVPFQPEEEAKQAEARHEDFHLRGIREVTGYHIEAKNGRFGHVEDFMIDPDCWTIRYLLIDTRNFMPGKPVLMSPEWVYRVDWNERIIVVDLAKEAIENSPEYDADVGLTKEYEERLCEHYDRAKYWKA